MVAFAEHPEDLGKVLRGRKGTPASIWRMKEFQKLLEQGWWSGAFRQCDFEAPTPKPTRCLASSDEFRELAAPSTPVFKADGSYAGPVEKCTHKHSESLVRKPGDTGPFRSARAAAYPSAMCKAIAACTMKALRKWKPALRKGDNETGSAGSASSASSEEEVVDSDETDPEMPELLEVETVHGEDKDYDEDMFARRKRAHYEDKDYDEDKFYKVDSR